MWQLSMGLVGLVASGAWFVSFQRATMFPRHLVARAGAPPPADAAVVTLDTGEEQIEAWLLPPRGGGTGPSPLLLFAHGNAELIDHWPGAFEDPRRWGLAVLLVEYPGYGRSTGRPSERSVARAMAAAFDWAATRPEIDARRVVGYGRSVGGAAIGLLARDRALAALVLESTFTSAPAMARRIGVPGFLIRDRFDTLAALGRFAGPILLLHGTRDTIVPTEESRALAAANPRAELHLLACGHNDCPRPWFQLQNFLRANGILGTVAEERPVPASGHEAGAGPGSS
jgi:pimeloyl-ACP methyl ester carboxylesterase